MSNLPSNTPTVYYLRLMTIQEVLQHILQDAQQALTILKDTNSQDDIHIVLDRITGYQIDTRVPQHLKSFISNIQGKAHACIQHDFTLTQMCVELQILLSLLELEIEQEKQRKRLQEMDDISTLLKKHLEAILTLCEQNGISLS